MEYHYDVADPSTYQTRNNRLMYYETFDISDPQTPALLERVYYEYSEDVQAGRQGSPTTIVWETPQPSGPAAFRAIDLQYNHSGELWLAIRRHWSGTEGCEEVIDGITEFRGSGRTRRLVRQRDPAFPYLVAADTTRWTDYDGDEAYADYAMTLDPQTGVASPAQTAAYLPGVGFWNAAANEPQYVHGDQVGTARLLTGPSAAVRARTVMTAFGEPIQASGTGVPPVGTRYGYAGSWGYEEAECRVIDLNGPEPGGETTWCDPLAELGWLHVGHRYYDPTSGRFVQRDPLGIRAGTNAYQYADADPLLHVDPSGLLTWISKVGRGIQKAGAYVAGAGCLIALYAIIAEGPTVGMSTPVGIAGGTVGIVGGTMIFIGEGMQDFDEYVLPGMVLLRDCGLWWIREELRRAKKFVEDWGDVVLY